jgi:uncharacterized delta-60 repeat protein
MKKIILLLNAALSINCYGVVESDFLSSVALQSDGKIVAGGNSIINSVQQFGLVRVNTNGTVDSTFGTNGIVNTIIGSSSEIAGIAIQTDGKIIAAGQATVSNISNIAIARYNTNGSLDTSFNTTGIVTTTIDDGAIASAIVLQPIDGKIVIAGSVIINATANFIIARYNTDGSLDTTFNSTGFATTLINTTANATSIAIQSDNKLVVAGSSFIGLTGVSQFTIVRYNTDGSLDNTFGSSGIVTTTIGTTALVFDVALQADGKIVVGGTSDSDFAIARYNTDGSLDTTFSGDGIFTASLNDNNEIHAVAIQTDGKIVAGGISDIFFALARFNTNGTLDNTFGTNGLVASMLHQMAGANDIAIQTDGKIVAAGFDDNRAALARFNTNGSLDTAFAHNGILNSAAVPVTLDGEIIFNSFSMTKNASATPDTLFNDVYTTTGVLFPIRAWSLHTSSTTQEAVTIIFNIPQDFDTILPLQAELHLIVDNKAATGNNAALMLRADFKGNNTQFGAGAGGAEQTITSSTITFTEPTGNNLKHELLVIPLSNSSINPGDIAFLAFTRTAPTGTEYNADIYLGSISFRYKKFVSS